jgi:branched-subunit amino acid transport protein
MSPVWASVLAVGAATVAIKASGPLLAAGRELPKRLAGVVGLLAPALLAALVATQAFSSERELMVDERAAGLLVAAVAILLRAPLLAVVVVAAVTAAALRAL